MLRRLSIVLVGALVLSVLSVLVLGVSAQGELFLMPGDVGFSVDMEIVDLDTSADSTCGLTSGGDITCWGQNISAPILARGFVDVATGRTFTCGLKSDGTVQCFGFDRFSGGQTTPPVSDEGEAILFSEIDSYASHLCGIGLNDGRVVCWGYDSHGQSSGTSASRSSESYDYSGDEFSYIRAGKTHSCGVLKGGSEAGNIRCWGDNFYNQSTVPATYASTAFTAVEAGSEFTCGLLAEGEEAGKAVCWGDDQYRAVSDVPDAERFVDISANDRHVCGVTAVGHVRCWGAVDKPHDLKVDYGQTSVPVDYRDATFSKVISAEYHSCGILDGRNDQAVGEVVCWGAEFEYDPTAVHLVDGGRADSSHYRYPALGADPKVDTGRYYNCGLTVARDIVCWGGGSTKRTFTKGPFIDLSVGWDHTCGVREGGGVMCWGRNNNLQSRGWSGPTLSSRLQANSALVENLTTDYTFKSVSASLYHTCGILDGLTAGQTSGAVMCWGHNGEGQSTPPSSTFKEISTGLYHGCGLRDGQNGQLENGIECWGAIWADGRTGLTAEWDPTSDYGQADIPLELEDVEFRSVSAGFYHTCGVRKDDGAMECWGYPQVAEIPADMQELEFSSVSVSRFSTCGITADNRVKCWGPSAMAAWPSTPVAWGAVPARYLNQHRVPEVYVDVEFESVSASMWHVCATRPGGTVACWGADAIPSTAKIDVFVGKEIINTGQAWVPRSFRASPPTATPTPTVTPTPTITPTPTATPTPILLRILRIEPAIRGVHLGLGERVSLRVEVYGRQDLRDDSLGDRHDITFDWTVGEAAALLEGGDFREDVRESDDRVGNGEVDDRRALHIASSEPGRYMVSAALDPGTECVPKRDGETDQDAIDRCTAIFEITVTRFSPPEATPVPPRDPSGEIPSVIVDDRGTNYEVFTPEGGGEFITERCSFRVPEGSVKNDEVMGIFITELETPEERLAVVDPRFATEGVQCQIDAVAIDGTRLTDYRLRKAGDICMPLPDAFRPKTFDVLVGSINTEATLTALSSRLYLANSAGELKVCGALSSLSATTTVALRAEVAVELSPTPAPEIKGIETGGVGLSNGRTVLLMLLGIAGILAGGTVLVGRRRE